MVQSPTAALIWIQSALNLLKSGDLPPILISLKLAMKRMAAIGGLDHERPLRADFVAEVS